MSESAIIIHSDRLHEAIKKLRFPDEVLQKILNRAVVQTARWAKRRAATIIGKSTKISGRVLGKRMRLDIESAEHGYARIWVGLNPVKLGGLNPRKTASGVKAGPMQIAGGFIAKKQVFKRRGNKRLPIDRQELDIYPQASEALSKISEEVHVKLQEHFDRAYEAIAYK
jgi:hypothetical protein